MIHSSGPLAAIIFAIPQPTLNPMHSHQNHLQVQLPQELAEPPRNFATQTRANALDPSQLDPKRAKRIVANRQVVCFGLGLCHCVSPT